jgi:hypothetical protein
MLAQATSQYFNQANGQVLTEIIRVQVLAESFPISGDIGKDGAEGTNLQRVVRWNRDVVLGAAEVEVSLM